MFRKKPELADSAVFLELGSSKVLLSDRFYSSLPIRQKTTRGGFNPFIDKRVEGRRSFLKELNLHNFFGLGVSLTIPFD